MYRIYADNQLLYSPKAAANGPYGLISPMIEYSELGSAGSLSFTVLPDHPMYEKLHPLKTMFSVMDGNEEIFKGRLLSADSDFFNQKNITCEGDLVVLKDSPQSPATMTKSIRDLFTYYVQTHNAWVETNKRFEVGDVTIDNADTEMVTVDSKEFRKTRDAIDNDLINVYGGYLRARTTNGIRYLDYLKEYGRTSSQVLRFGDNIIDLTQCVSVENIFSVLIGYGDDSLTIASVNGGSAEIEVEGAVDKWGKIVKIEQFSGITDAATLKTEMERFIKIHYTAKPRTITVTALDLKRMGVDVSDIRLGDRVRIYSKPHGLNDYYVCTSVSYDIVNPGNTTYTFGDPLQTMSKKYARTNQQIEETNNAVGRVGSGLGATASLLEQYITATDDTLMLQHTNILLNAHNIQANAEAIKLKAETSYVDGVERRVGLVEVDLNGDDSTLGLKATVKNLSEKDVEFERRMANAELKLDGDEGTAGLLTQVSEILDWAVDYEGEFHKLKERVGSAELTLNGEQGRAGLITRMNLAEQNYDKVTGEVSKARNGINTVAIQLDATNSTLTQTVVKVLDNESNYATLKMYVDGDLQSVLSAKADRIELNGYVTADRLDSEFAEFSTAISDNLFVRDLGAKAFEVVNLSIGGSSVSKSTIPVVTAFTQASGQTAGTTNYTILTTAVANGVARMPAAGTTITDFSNLQ